MKFGIFYEHQLPRPWSDGAEQRLFNEALDQEMARDPNVILMGEGYGKVRSIHDDRGNLIEEAGPSVPVEVTGLSGPDEGGQEAALLIEVGKDTPAKELERISRLRGVNFDWQADVREARHYPGPQIGDKRSPAGDTANIALIRQLAQRPQQNKRNTEPEPRGKAIHQ